MSHEYSSDTPKIRVGSTGHRSAELPADETQRREPALGSVQHTIGTVAIAEGDGAAPTHHIQDALDADMDPPLFPVPEASESSRPPVGQHHSADMEPEI